MRLKIKLNIELITLCAANFTMAEVRPVLEVGLDFFFSGSPNTSTTVDAGSTLVAVLAWMDGTALSLSLGLSRKPI